MPRRSTSGVLLLLILASSPCAATSGAAGDTEAGARATAEAIRAIAGVDAGLCVHLGCGEGALTAELVAGGRFLVHGLAAERGDVARARRHIERLGLYGQASVARADFAWLPYADGMANLVVVDDLPKAAAAGLTLAEVLRVLCPGGVAVLSLPAEAKGRDGPPVAGGGIPRTEGALRQALAAAGVRRVRVVRRGGVWACFRAPRPPAMDDWTHRTYDAGGNCVSQDTAIGPLQGLRWLAGPVWPMGTGYQVSNGGIVSAGGRVFHVTLNEVSNARRVPQDRNHEWFLTARDAYNGLLLWSRPIRRKMRRDGQEFGNYLVASAGRVYALIGEDLVGLDPAGGRTLATYRKGVALGGRLALRDGTLVLSQPTSICAIDAASAKERWEHPAEARDVLVGRGAVLYATADYARLASLDLATGLERWQVALAPRKGRKKQLLFTAGGVVVYVWERDWQKGENGMAAFRVSDGRRLWDDEYASSRATWANTVWYVGGLVWRREGKAGLVGLDPATGKAVRRIAMKGGYCGGCVRDIATKQYLVSTRPPNLFEWRDGSMHAFRGGRHGCRAGVIVANGMLYSQPHGCKCVRESLRGFLAFAPRGTKRPETAPRLERGPAGAPAASRAAPGDGDWPMFRHDPRRTGAAATAVPVEMKRLWDVRLDDQRRPAGRLADEWAAHPLGPDRLTAPVVAGGRVVVALRDAHRVVALDAGSGRVCWSRTVGGRVDVPPAIHDGLCLVGCYDGFVYCLRADSGELVWRLRAAPEDRRIVACGQLESSWPVVGGVLVAQGRACFVAGRSSAVGGGLRGYAVEPRTGTLLWQKPLPAASSDLLVLEDGALRLAGGGSAGARFDPATGKALRSIASPGFRWDYAGKIRTLWGGPNRVLDRTWHVLSVNDTASHWMRIKQGYGPHQGQLLVASPDGRRVCGFRFKYIHWSKVKDRRTELGGELVAWEGGKQRWKVDVPGPFQVEALCLAGDVLLAAGPTDRFRRTPGGRLWLLSAADGTKRKEYALDAPPAADGLAVADGRLYLTTHDGRTLCYGAE